MIYSYEDYRSALEQLGIDTNDVAKAEERLNKVINVVNEIAPRFGRFLSNNDSIRIVGLTFTLMDMSQKYKKMFPEVLMLHDYFKRKLPAVNEFLQSAGAELGDVRSATALAAALAYTVPDYQEVINDAAAILTAKVANAVKQLKKLKAAGKPAKIDLSKVSSNEYLQERLKENMEKLERHGVGDAAVGIALNLLSFETGGPRISIDEINAIKKIFQHAKESIDFVLKSMKLSLPAGVPQGIRPIRNLEEIPWLTPEEQAFIIYDAASPELSDYEVYKILSGQAMVFDRKAIIKPYVFIDKSGSMGSVLSTPYGPLTYYQLAAALGAAVLDATNAPPDNVYLFDAVPYRLGDILNNKLHNMKLADAVAKTLKKYRLHPSLAVLTIHPGGGTNINAVFSTIMSLRKLSGRHGLYLIITDAMDYTNAPLVYEAMKKVKNIYMAIIVNDLNAAKEAAEELRKFKPEVMRKIRLGEEGGYEFHTFMPAMFPDQTILIPPDKLRRSELRKIFRVLQAGVRSAAQPA